MFIGRKKELHSLEELYAKDGFTMTVIYGRRRIGKSTLIAEFIRDKKAIYYTATKVGKERNLELFAAQAAAFLAPELTGVSFNSLESLLDFISARVNSSGDKLIIAIDELPYWAEKDSALLSVLQKYIDTRWQECQLMLILCGSALSFMEGEVLGEKSPLFGRRTSQIKLEEFTYDEAADFVPQYSYEEKAISYGITGGVAKYLSLLDGEKSLDDNIKRLFFHTDGYLYDETHNLLTQEFSDISIVNNIIEQIASGANTVNVISGKIGEKEQTVLYFLDKLVGVGLVEKKRCITEEKNKKKVQYLLKDHMFKFWYEFIPKACSVIEIGGGDDYYERQVKPNLHMFMGSVFEKMCRYYTLKQGISGKYGSFLTNVGSWWGIEKFMRIDGTQAQQTADIDVVGISDIDKTAVIGECKFRNERIDKGVYEKLARRASLISAKYKVTGMLLFSLAGYTEWFDQFDCNADIEGISNNNGLNVWLLTLADLYDG